MFKVKLNTKALSYMALFVAMHIVLEYLFKIIPAQPEGGSITLSLLPIFLCAYLMGPGYGIIVGLVCAAVQFALGLAVFYGPWSVLLDYVLPLAVLGLAPLFHSIALKKGTFYTGIVVSMVMKYFIHVLSGALLFASYAPKGMNPWVYSLGYNAIYNIGTLILSYVVFALVYPRVKNSIKFTPQTFS